MQGYLLRLNVYPENGFRIPFSRAYFWQSYSKLRADRRTDKHIVALQEKSVSTQLYRAMLWWPRIDVHKKRLYQNEYPTKTAVAPYDDFTTISLRKEEEKIRN